MHNWQDIVLGAGSLILAAALLPSIFSKHKPALWTSVLTGAVLTTFAVTYSSLRLWYAATTTLLTALLWFTLAVQRVLDARIRDQSD